jgi:hypothetical protein
MPCYYRPVTLMASTKKPHLITQIFTCDFMRPIGMVLVQHGLNVTFNLFATIGSTYRQESHESSLFYGPELSLGVPQ